MRKTPGNRQVDKQGTLLPPYCPQAVSAPCRLGTPRVVAFVYAVRFVLHSILLQLSVMTAFHYCPFLFSLLFQPFISSYVSCPVLVYHGSGLCCVSLHLNLLPFLTWTLSPPFPPRPPTFLYLSVLFYQGSQVLPL